MRRMRTPATGFLVHQAEGQPFVEPVGKLMINFGGIELYSYIWIIELSRDEVLLDLAVDLSFGRRVELILHLIERERMPKGWKANSTDLWNAAKKLAEVRNTIAHSPIVFSWRNPPYDRPPDVVGIPNLRYLKRKHRRVLPVTPLPDVFKSIDEVATVGLRLQQHLEQLRTRLSARSSRRARKRTGVRGKAP